MDRGGGRLSGGLVLERVVGRQQTHNLTHGGRKESKLRGIRGYARREIEEKSKKVGMERRGRSDEGAEN